MKTLYIQDVRDLHIKPGPDPELTEDSVIVEIRLSGIMTEQVGMWNGADPRIRKENTKHPLYRGGHPCTLPSDWAGEIIAVGSAVRDVKVGDRTAGYGPMESPRRVPSASYVKLAPDLDFDELVSISYAAHGLHCIRQARIGVGENVVVVGQGPMGLGATHWAAFAGAGKVIATDRYENRLAIAKKVGATHVLNPDRVDVPQAVRDLTEGRGADVVINAAHSPPAFQYCLRLAGEKARVVVLSWYTEPITIDDMTDDFWVKELEIVASKSAGPPDSLHSPHVRWTHHENLKLVARMMKEGRYSLKSLITSRFPVQEAQSVLTFVEERPQDVVKAVLDW